MKSKVSLLLLAISEKEISDVEAILSSDVDCFGASKSSFISKLEYIYEQIRLSGLSQEITITKLEFAESTYAMTLKAFDITNIFAIKEHQGKILRLYNNLEQSDYDNMINPLEFYFADDERLNFIANDSYLDKLSICIKALDEIDSEKKGVLKVNDIEIWLEKYKKAFQNMKDDFSYQKFYRFKFLFERLYEIKNVVNLSNRARNAIRLFNNNFSHFKSESSLEIRTIVMPWLEQYRTLYFDDLFIFHHCIRQVENDNTIVLLMDGKIIKINDSEVKDLFDFCELYMSFPVE